MAKKRTTQRRTTRGDAITQADDGRARVTGANWGDDERPAIVADPAECVHADESDAAGEFEIAGLIEPDAGSSTPPDSNDAARRIDEKRTMLDPMPRPAVDAEGVPAWLTLDALAREVDAFRARSRRFGSVGVRVLATGAESLATGWGIAAHDALRTRAQRPDASAALVAELRGIRDRAHSLHQQARGLEADTGQTIRIPLDAPLPENPPEHPAARSMHTLTTNARNLLASLDALARRLRALSDELHAQTHGESAERTQASEKPAPAASSPVQPPAPDTGKRWSLTDIADGSGSSERTVARVLDAAGVERASPGDTTRTYGWSDLAAVALLHG